MIRILVAMEREGEALGLPFEIINIGGTSIPPINPDDIIVNVGYCGSERIPVGMVVEPLVAVDSETGESVKLEGHFSCSHAVCITSTEFVSEPPAIASQWSRSPVIYDMELAKLARIPCKALYSLKIVSDSLNEDDCEAFSDADAWNRVREMILSQLSITQPE